MARDVFWIKTLHETEIADLRPVGAGGLMLPAGSTTQRPSSAPLGTIRFNTTLNEIEILTTGGWNTLSSLAAGVIGYTNLGSGISVVSSNTGGILNFRTISAGYGIVITSNINDINISLDPSLGYLPLAGGTMSGQINMNNNNIVSANTIDTGSLQASLVDTGIVMTNEIRLKSGIQLDFTDTAGVPYLSFNSNGDITTGGTYFGNADFTGRTITLDPSQIQGDRVTQANTTMRGTVRKSTSAENLTDPPPSDVFPDVAGVREIVAAFGVAASNNVTKSGFTLTWTDGLNTVTWDDGAVSSDANNAITRGSDLGIYVSADSITVTTPSQRMLAHTDNFGNTVSWYDGAISTDAGNLVTVGTDGGIFVPQSSIPVVTKTGFDLTWTDGVNTITWDDGTISTDAGNAITRGSDSGLFAPTVTVPTLSKNTYILAWNDGINTISWHDGMISADAGNLLTRGSDNGLYLSSPSSTTVTKTGYDLTWTDGFNTVTWDDGTISADTNNAITRGSDNGLYAPATTVTRSIYTLTWTDGSNNVTWDDGAISADVGNSISRGSDGGLFTPTIPTVTKTGFDLTWTDGVNTVTWDDGTISTDAGNVITRGSDDGLFAPSDSISETTVLQRLLTHTDASGNAVSWYDGAISSDAGNALSNGTDGGLFVPNSVSQQYVLKLYIDGTAGSDTNDGLSPATPVKTVSTLSTIVSSYVNTVDTFHIYAKGTIQEDWVLGNMFTVDNHVSIIGWDTNPTANVVADTGFSVVASDVASFSIRDCVADTISCECQSNINGIIGTRNISATNNAIVTGNINSLTTPSPTDVLIHARDAAMIIMGISNLTADLSNPSSDTKLVESIGGFINLFVGSGTINATNANTLGVFISTYGGFIKFNSSNMSISSSVSSTSTIIGAYEGSKVMISGDMSLNLVGTDAKMIVCTANSDVTLFSYTLNLQMDNSNAFIEAYDGANVKWYSPQIFNSNASASGSTISASGCSIIQITGNDQFGTPLDKNSLMTTLKLTSTGTVTPGSMVIINTNPYWGGSPTVY